ncbi:S-receptor-like serine/threonine-protein kinase [Parasponia andersonii]|uniref:Receptor-like serine/threonine-protein kinase n=1 Tax=Parasponia andersonii TaxID=3476 RepID=A0A2P5BJA0_PARAD|nr:S-receptor-like serine/threonine-protein kinase [Parasponia andersonii]
MASLFIFHILFMAISSQLSSSNSDTLIEGSSLSVEKPYQVLTSSNKVFSAGFFPVGLNAYCFAIWFNEPSAQPNRTIIWMANRDRPVNGKYSKLCLQKTGNLVLTDTSLITVWTTNTVSRSLTQLHLYDSGNMVLQTSDGIVLWQSFDLPTDTLLPNQIFTKYAKLVSSRSQTNFSSGFYKFFFDTDNVLRLAFDNNVLSSVFWPFPWFLTWQAGRSTYNNNKVAVLDSLGNFSSSDDFTFMSADYGSIIQRRLKLDHDGNLRLYTRKTLEESWEVSWEAFPNPCRIHGICGANSLCKYIPNGRKCSCLPGYKMKNLTDWSYGCEPKFNASCSKNESRFILIFNAEFYGYDYGIYYNYTYRDCETLCMQLCNCKGFQYSFYKDQGYYNCFPKMSLLNGYHRPGFSGNVYLRLPKANFSSSYEEFGLDCSSEVTSLLARTYRKSRENETVKFMLLFACGVGGFEFICILLVWCSLIRTQQNSGADKRGYLLAATGFKRFSFAELKRATWGFAEEIGRGAGGIVYKGVLSDSRVAAIKRLSEAYQGEAEFLAEVNTIGRLNHMNLIEMWGFCAEGKHRLLVYEYVEHGSLKENLSSKVLDWKMRFEIALGTAKALAYLHEECLEWVLHCDVKPQNILLDSNYQPKVSDFGLSKLQNRGELRNLSFSRIRGTRGYMAPEWVTNQSITSKVDVYSYGIVLLEILSGMTPSFQEVTLLKEMVNRSSIDMASCVENIMDTSAEGEFDVERLGVLLAVAIKCVEEEKDTRPTMRQVIEMLQDH